MCPFPKLYIMKYMKYIVATLVCSLATVGVSADNIKLPIDTISLNEVVVTATRNPIARKLAPSLVNVLPHKIFDDMQASCLAQGLSFVPGVRVEDNCQNCGWTQARINGLDGHYSQILVDSRPLFSALTNVYGLEQIPSNMIDHVEVIRGGGSALFGSSAIGGTINIITKEPKENSADVQHTLTNIGGSKSYENNTTFNASVVSRSHKIGAFVFGSNRYRQPYDFDGDGFSELNKIVTKSLGARIAMQPSDFSHLTIDYRGTHDFRRGGSDINLPPHQAELAETTEHDIQSGGINFDWADPSMHNKINTYFSFQHTDRNSYYGAEKSPNNYGLTHNMTYVLGAQYTRHIDKLLFLPAYITTGAEYNSDRINDESIGYKIFTTQHARTASVYAQNEWRNEFWSLLVGGRLDKHNLINHAIFSPRVNVRYTPSQFWNFRLSMSGGFRAPQAYDEDLHVDLVNGERRVIRLAPNLHEESSISYSGSADYHHRWGDIIADFILEAFYTDLSHTFAIRSTGEKSAEGDRIDERYNSSGSRVYGMNAELQMSFGSFMDMQAGFTVQESRYKEAQKWSDDASVQTEQRMFRSPRTYGYLSADFTPFKNFSAAVTANYSGSMLVQHKAGSGVSKDVAVNTPSFWDTNIKVSYNIPLCSNALNMQLSAGVLNVFNSYQKDFDKGVERDSNYIYGPMQPRSYYGSVRFYF